MHKQMIGREHTDTTMRISINRGEVLSLPPEATWIRAEFGRIWLTEGRRDVVLSPGMEYNPRRPANTLLTALGGQPAGLTIAVPCDDPSQKARARLQTLAWNRP